MNGIVKFELAHAVDHDGGRSLNAPENWVNVLNFQVSYRHVTSYARHLFYFTTLQQRRLQEGQGGGTG